MDKKIAIEKLQQQINRIESLKNKLRFSPEFKKWKRDTEITIERIFGKNGRHLSDFTKIRYNLGIFGSSTPDYKFQEAFCEGLDDGREVLKSMIDEINEWGIGQSSLSTSESTKINTFVNANEIFIVHGRDEAAKQAVSRFIEKLGLKPVILHEQPNQGKTIIEKFEKYSNVGFAVVLLTPDDLGAIAEDADNLKPRARQNVILELGFFVGRLGRHRVCVLYKHGVELPSDYKGVLFIPFDEGNGWQLALSKEIKASGIEVDLNKAMLPY